MRYMKKPVVITARQYTGTPEEKAAVFGWAQVISGDMDETVFLTGDEEPPSTVFRDPVTGQFKINTPEGVMTVTEGDWVIQGVLGEIYPCKPEVFEQTYEPVAE